MRRSREDGTDNGQPTRVLIAGANGGVVVARLYTAPAHEQRPRRLKLRDVGQRTLSVLPSLDGVANGAILHRDADQVVRRYAAVLFAYLLTGTEPDEDTTAGRTAWVKGMQSLAATMVGGKLPTLVATPAAQAWEAVQNRLTDASPLVTAPTTDTMADFFFKAVRVWLPDGRPTNDLEAAPTAGRDPSGSCGPA